MIYKYQRSGKTGFTVIELMLAMAFLAAVLMLATLVFVQALNTYNRALTLRQIDSVGQAITADLNRVNQGAASIVTGLNSQPGRHFICIGQTAYLWNDRDVSLGSAYRLNGATARLIRTNVGVNGSTFCSSSPGNINVPATQGVEMIGGQVRVLDTEITDLAPPAGATAKMVRVVLTIGSDTGDASVDPEDPGGGLPWRCPPGSIGSFCAVGTYSTTIYIP